MGELTSKGPKTQKVPDLPKTSTTTTRPKHNETVIVCPYLEYIYAHKPHFLGTRTVRVTLAPQSALMW